MVAVFSYDALIVGGGRSRTSETAASWSRPHNHSRVMARYFIDLKLRGKLIPDPEGVELETLDAVFALAISSAKEMVATDLLHGMPLSDALDGSIEICEENSATVAAFSFREAAEKAPGLAGPLRRG